VTSSTESGSRGVAVVTGAARGIGAGVSRVLAQEGWSIAAVDLDGCDEVVAAVRGAGGVAAGFTCDVRDWSRTHEVMAEIEAELGQIRSVAAVAGVFESVPFLDLTEDVWRRTLATNLDGTFFTCHAAAERLVRNGGGGIVCISSNAALLAWDAMAQYAASKAGMLGLVRCIAFELGRHGVRANAILPGTVRTPLNRLERADPDWELRQASMCPVGRIGEPEDIGHAVSFLLDPVRAAWITGELLYVDGGYGSHGEGASEFGLTRSETLV
jgi:NAD(P)-dependent dehydrogenase (short-subunit alcohol dehydrogenase family)